MDDFEGRLVSRLAAYEESVPAPTSPAAASVPASQSRPRPALLLVPAALVVVIGVVFGLAGSGLLTGVRPVGTGQVTSLEWETHPFVPGARVAELTTIGDRLIASGSLQDEAAAWYSDDGGETWTQSVVDSSSARTGAALDGMPQEIGEVASVGSRLIGLDAYRFSSSQTAAGSGATHTGVWISDDQGSNWRWTSGIEGQADDIAQSVHGLIAAGTADLKGNGGPRSVAAWSSADGTAWTELSLSGIDPGSVWTSITFDGSRLMAVGSAPAPASKSEAPMTGVTPAAWLSTDGSRWIYMPLDPSLVGEAAAVAASTNGFNVAGGAYSRGDPGEEQPKLWRTVDGSVLFTQALQDDPSTRAEVAQSIAINSLGSMISVGSNQPASSVKDRLWFIPSVPEASPVEQRLQLQVTALAGLSDRFVIFSQCGPAGDCDNPLVSIGIPPKDGPPASVPSISPSATEFPIGGVRAAITRQNLTAARNSMAGGLFEAGWLPDGYALVYAEYSADGDVINSVDLRYEGGGHYVHVWQTHASSEELGEKDPVAKGSPLTGMDWNANPLQSEQGGRADVVEYSRNLSDGRTVTVDSDLDSDTMRRVLDSMYLHPASPTLKATPTLQPTPQPTESALPTSSPIGRDEAIAGAREFALLGESTTLLAADEGPRSRFDLGANQKASTPPADTLVWRVIFRTGEGGQLRIVILDAYSGELIETVAAIE